MDGGVLMGLVLEAVSRFENGGAIYWIGAKMVRRLGEEDVAVLLEAERGRDGMCQVGMGWDGKMVRGVRELVGMMDSVESREVMWRELG